MWARILHRLVISRGAQRCAFVCCCRWRAPSGRSRCLGGQATDSLSGKVSCFFPSFSSTVFGLFAHLSEFVIINLFCVFTATLHPHPHPQPCPSPSSPAAAEWYLRLSFVSSTTRESVEHTHQQVTRSTILLVLFSIFIFVLVVSVFFNRIAFA